MGHGYPLGVELISSSETTLSFWDNGDTESFWKAIASKMSQNGWVFLNSCQTAGKFGVVGRKPRGVSWKFWNKMFGLRLMNYFQQVRFVLRNMRGDISVYGSRISFNDLQLTWSLGDCVPASIGSPDRNRLKADHGVSEKEEAEDGQVVQ